MRTPPLPRAGRPRVGIPVRLSSSSDPDPRVAEANELFEYIVSLLREGGADPVLLTDALLGGPSAIGMGTDDGGRLAEVLTGLDGVVLPGGGDLDPLLYGQERSAACYDVNGAQDALDLAVARRAIDAGVPLLGICRGHQLLNVLYGGTLVQDLATGTVTHHEPVPDCQTGPWAWHTVDLMPDSKVSGLYGVAGGSQDAALTVKIASGHHQAVALVAEGLMVTATAGDGTVEALEDPARWVASVQWHPEARELPAADRIAPFRAFVDVCRGHR
ncbi:gamma-glutamyl-gamma-aminobutyrate hydrolase family protein [Arthrobacter sp. 92]|uniref:gamma-glutamyl-gamma-aminobutyrate hydrolase family protein n=1 Tax=Arthrobacter sp. 92 TaxID=3418175 RepID=UPI003CFF87D9